MTDEQILNAHTERVELLNGSLAASESSSILENVQQVKMEALITHRNNDLDVGEKLIKYDYQLKAFEELKRRVYALEVESKQSN